MPTTEWRYQLAGHGTARVALEGLPGEATAVGYAVVTPDASHATPAGTLIFQFHDEGEIVTEAGVGRARATTLARIYVDEVGTQTGVAVANPGLAARGRSLMVRAHGSCEAETRREEELMRFHHDDEQQSIRPQPPCARRVTAASHPSVAARHFLRTRRSVDCGTYHLAQRRRNASHQTSATGC